jgi:hypothetical protein
MKKYLSKNMNLLLGTVFSIAFFKPAEAMAHLVTTGMGPVYDGIGHLLLTPEDLVPALAMALYAGLRGKAPGRRADLRLPDNLFTSLAVLVGIMHGFFNGIALKAGPAGLGLLGIISALFVLVAMVSAFVVSLKPPWTRIVVRVAGSWVAAMGLLMIGWFFRGQV